MEEEMGASARGYDVKVHKHPGDEHDESQDAHHGHHGHHHHGHHALHRSHTHGMDGNNQGSLRKSVTANVAAQEDFKRREADVAEFRMLVNLSRKYAIRLEELKDAREKFKRHDSSG